jgi:DNA-binding MarR family transcriptional regulator
MSALPISREERIKRTYDAFISLMWIASRQFSQKLQHLGLTHPQFAALAALVAHKRACTMSDLTKVTFQDPPTMTGIVDRLAKTKLVQRTRSETDRRVVLVQATPPGIDLVKQVTEVILRDDITGCASLTDDELAALEQLLEYVLRIHLRRHKPLQDADLDAELEKLRLFIEDPISFARLEAERQLGSHTTETD